MTVRCPAGVRPLVQGEGATKKKKGSPKLKVAAGNRGMDFEAEINQTNDYYREKDLAVFHKRPTPINIVKVDYSRGAKITEAYFEAQSTTDYNGIYQGHYVDFEAKSIRGKTSFPLSNIPPQQIEHLKAVLRHDGIGFFLIRFATLNRVFLLPASFVIDFYEKRERASIPLEEIEAHGKEITAGYRPRYDFLPILEELFLK